MDAFTENWGEVFGLFVPPVISVPRVLKQIQEQRARCVLVILLWPSGLFGLFYAWARGDLPSKLQIGWICPFQKIFIRPQRVVGGVLVQKTYVFIESELSRFINLSCIRITFQLGQCCQDHIFVYGDNYKRCYLITFCFNKSWEKTASMCLAIYAYWMRFLLSSS